MIKTEFIIVGQGISGTFLSWYLHKAGHRFIVIDSGQPSSSSRVAAGIINPVTGRRIVETWMIETLLPFSLKAYEEFGNDFKIKAISGKSIIDFFPSPQMLNAFRERLTEGSQYLQMADDPLKYHNYFNYDFGYGEIGPCYMVNLNELLPAWRKFLNEQDILIEEEADINDISINEKEVIYKDIHAEKIIFCDGIGAAINPWFRNLPFAFNKGEALIISSDHLPDGNIYKKGITLAPLGSNLFWAGTSHEWNFNDSGPSAIFLERITRQLGNWLKVPFKTEAHLASVRPATIERRPFVGLHPHYPRIGIFNGMGTKGCSLAPYFADQFVNHLTKNTPILPEANVNRFSRILKTII
jgi:glycine/D-amino acid oxidase-like deaminating enzyme